MSLRHIPLLGCSVVLLSLSGVAEADDAFQQALSIQPFSHADSVQEQLLPESEYQVIIGSIRRINNQLRAGREVRASGELLRATWQMRDGYSPDEAFKDALQQLTEQPNTLLYTCEGRECGSSSLWANQVFNNAKLYGPDEDQRYLALRLDSEPQRFISLYSITRGNKRSYLHLDQFTPKPAVTEALYPTPTTLLKVLKREGELLLPSVDMTHAEAEPTVEWVRLLVRMLRSDSLLRVSIDGAGAPALVEALKIGGIPDQRLIVGQPAPEQGVRITRIR
ncbi:MAG TPA: DUF4892 domain-containing protein [Pseudomonas sabulinigri]|uniref:DUF4892 domain-containing protein n=1 Tax=marine sediment metagenome TaxID=412755 RepID=A0A0F9VGC9_9ZZZZ|nr:DUF4892 domain-containing protein [Halopseudomonas sabulinigri]HEC51565.1 DUF4892 domain-containing protein [Halopseudomonas sabulinigri]|tara:strand:- start:2806 stop:3642 length:837 start_codon:yes stop_codon:yes gene_type:complete